MSPLRRRDLDVGNSRERALRALGRTRSRTITLDELRTAEWLRDGDGWVAATLAEQTVFRLMERQGHGGR